MMRKKQLICLALALVTFVAYSPVLNNEFITYDDGSYITENPAVLSGLSWASIQWAFNVGYSGNWHPLTWLSHMVDVSLFGVNPSAHHLTNLLLHMANSILLFLLFQRMTKVIWPSFFVAIVFALHPLHVQSVAWAAERKDVLSTLFWLLTMLVYVRHVERPTKTRYLLSLVFFALGLMAKPMLVSLPIVLLLIDYWPLGRTKFAQWKKEQTPKKRDATQTRAGGMSPGFLLKEKLPFVGLAIVSSVITFLAQREAGAVAGTGVLSPDLRITNAFVSYIVYIGKTFWPSNLAFFYPHPAEHLPFWQAVVASLILIAVSVGAIMTAKRRPYITFGWFWYLVTLVPVIGIVQVGLQAMADRYMYIPIIGLSVMIGWGVPDFLKELNKRVLAFAVAVVAVSMAASTFVQAGYWRSSHTLYERAIEVTDHNWVAHTNLGVVLAKEGRVNDAMAQYRQALQIKPDYVEARRLLAFHLANGGKVDEAITHFREALKISPKDPEAHNNLGSLLARQGKIHEALSEYREALQSNPNYADARFNLGFFLSQQGQTSEAIEQYKEAVRIKPDYADARLNLGNLLIAQGKTDEAIVQYTELTRNNPDYEKGHFALGIQLAGQGKFREAIAQYKEALRINPNYAEVNFYLGQAQAALARTQDQRQNKQ